MNIKTALQLSIKKVIVTTIVLVLTSLIGSGGIGFPLKFLAFSIFPALGEGFFYIIYFLIDILFWYLIVSFLIFMKHTQGLIAAIISVLAIVFGIWYWQFGRSEIRDYPVDKESCEVQGGVWITEITQEYCTFPSAIPLNTREPDF